MSVSQPAGIQLHLISGRSRMFYQDDARLVDEICSDLNGQIFARPSLILDSGSETTAFPGNALIGITVLIDPLPESFLQHERASKAIISQLSEATFLSKRVQIISKKEGVRGVLLSELEFVNGERLYLEFNEVAMTGMGERHVLQHLFSSPSISCRRLDCGFSIWNTAHVVSWSHYPKMESPTNAWLAESLDKVEQADLMLSAPG